MVFRSYCRGWRFDWRKLILPSCVVTTAGALLQIFAIRYPLAIWFLYPIVTDSSYKNLNNTFQALKPLPGQVKSEQFPPFPIVPIGSWNTAMPPVSMSEQGEMAGISPWSGPAYEAGGTDKFSKGTVPEDGGSEKLNKVAADEGGSAEKLNNGGTNVGGGTEKLNNNVPAAGRGTVAHNGAGTEEVNKYAAHEGEGTVKPDKDAAHEDGGTDNVNKDGFGTRPIEQMPKHPPKDGLNGTKDMVQPPGNVNVSAAVKRTRTSRPQKSVRSMSPDEALVYAKKEIENAPVILDDPDLYAPLFRNVSQFKRSYELMEKILKVYIYRDGSRPIFHTPELRGIYASEGWFMKLMEENKWFVVMDAKRAHLFYLPYSARQLELALYVPDSHNMRPLSLFLKDYVNMIAAKYPFWNRTQGSDHFLVACHDWGPYTTTEHEELYRNTIKALCNADASEGIFIRGKDVSLPETTIRNPKKLLRDLGGKPISMRPILAFFAGNMHGRVRPVLLEYWQDRDKDMKIYGPLPPRVSRKMSYIQHMKSSKFCICPMGYEVNSPRIVESIYYECVPVIIADNFVLPFDEVLNWSAFSVIVAEKDIPNLKEILLKIPLRRYVSMQTNVKKLQKHFLWHTKPIKYDIFHMILHSIWFNRLSQIQIPQ